MKLGPDHLAELIEAIAGFFTSALEFLMTGFPVTEPLWKFGYSPSRRAGSGSGSSLYSSFSRQSMIALRRYDRVRRTAGDASRSARRTRSDSLVSADGYGSDGGNISLPASR